MIEFLCPDVSEGAFIVGTLAFEGSPVVLCTGVLRFERTGSTVAYANFYDFIWIRFGVLAPTLDERTSDYRASYCYLTSSPFYSPPTLEYLLLSIYEFSFNSLTD